MRWIGIFTQVLGDRVSQTLVILIIYLINAGRQQSLRTANFNDFLYNNLVGNALCNLHNVTDVILGHVTAHPRWRSFNV